VQKTPRKRGFSLGANWDFKMSDVWGKLGISAIPAVSNRFTRRNAAK
jgi:hypothetical protein